MSLERFLKIVDGKAVLVNIYGNKIRTYYAKNDAVRVDWYNQKDESVQVQLSTGKILLINKNGGIIRTI